MENAHLNNWQIEPHFILLDAMKSVKHLFELIWEPIFNKQ